MNIVALIGRLTKDPEVRYTADGMAIANFSLAVDRPKRADAEKQADFPRITAFGKQAENCEKYLEKGRMLAVEGRIQTGSYEDKEGKKVYTTEVIANRIQFLEWKKDEQGAQQETTDGIPSGFAVVDDDDTPF